MASVKESPLLDTIQCLVFIFSSHGSDMDEIAFTDNRSIKPDDIIKMFGNKACKKLEGKPKIFIFPYCRFKIILFSDWIIFKIILKFFIYRGNKVDQGISEIQPYVADTEIEQKSMTQIDLKKIIEEEVEDVREDMVVCFATLQGDVSSRESDSGTWYLNDLYKTFAEHSHEYDLQKLLRRVAYETMKRQSVVDHEKKTIPIKQTPHTDYYNFNKMFYFSPGVANRNWILDFIIIEQNRAMNAFLS